MKKTNSSSVRSKLSNFWFYYWKFILIGIAVVAMGSFLVTNYLIKATDYNIIVLSRNENELDFDKIREVFSDYAVDQNADGTIKLEVRGVTPKEKELSNDEIIAGCISSLQSRDNYIYLMDPDLFDCLESQPEGKNIPEGFENLVLISPNNPGLKGKGYNIIGSPYQEKLGITDQIAEKYFSSGLLLVLRRPVIDFSVEMGEDVEREGYLEAVDTIKNILKGTPIDRKK